MTHGDLLLVEWDAQKQIAFAPGGRMETRESLAQTLERELHEELGAVPVTIGEYLGNIGHRWREAGGQEASCLHHFFNVTLGPGTPPEAVRANEPGRELRWLDRSHQDWACLRPPSLQLLFQAYRSGNRTLWEMRDVTV